MTHEDFLRDRIYKYAYFHGMVEGTLKMLDWRGSTLDDAKGHLRNALETLERELESVDAKYRAELEIKS